MLFDFVTIDFETANNNLSSACSVGLAYVKNNQIVDTDYYLLRPIPLIFDENNIKVNGITLEMVQTALTFDKFWGIIYPKICGNLLIAHNAVFDMSVLKRCLKEHNIDIPAFNYVCSIPISSLCCSKIGVKLIERAAYLGITINEHHNALDDAKVCAELVLKIISQTKAKNINELLDNNDNISVNNLTSLKALRSFDFKKNNSSSSDSNTNFFDKNIIDTDIDQKKRFEKACSSDVTPISIELKENYGVFKGSAKLPYITTLENCTCTDFKRRKKPCKHMYRLALEIGMMDTDIQVERI